MGQDTSGIQSGRSSSWKHGSGSGQTCSNVIFARAGSVNAMAYASARCEKGLKSVGQRIVVA